MRIAGFSQVPVMHLICIPWLDKIHLVVRSERWINRPIDRYAAPRFQSFPMLIFMFIQLKLLGPRLVIRSRVHIHEFRILRIR